MQSPWLVHLDSIGARFAEAPSRDLQISTPQQEVQLAASGTVIVPLTHIALIRVEGEDAAVFLHNLMSNDIKRLALHGAQYNSFNSPKGRMLASFVVWRTATGYLLQLSADLLAGIHKKLSMYVLRSKVRLSDCGNELALIGLAGPGAARALDAAGLALPPEAMSVSQGNNIQVVRLEHDRVQIVVPVAQAADVWQRLHHAGAKPAGTMAWRWLDIRNGVPLITAVTQDEFVAQMVNFELIGGVNFQKGCYPGQEIVARTQYLGKLKKRMFLAHIDGEQMPQPGTDVYAAEFGTQSCGKLTTVAPAPDGGFDALVVTQISAFESNDVHLGAPDGARLSFGALPYTVS